MKHWTSFLAELGDQIKKKGLRQGYLLEEIAETEKRLLGLKDLYHSKEVEIEDRCSAHWLPSDIKNAKRLAAAAEAKLAAAAK